MARKRKMSRAEKSRKEVHAGEEKPEQASLSGIHRPLSLVAQAEQTLRTAIENNVFPMGRLPTLLELSKQMNIGSATVRLALKSLQKEGLVVMRQRRGTFVRFPALQERLSRPRPKVLGYLQEELEIGGTDEILSRPCSCLMLEGAIFEASKCGYQLNIRSAKFFQLQETFEQMEASALMSGVIFETVVEEKFLKSLSGRGFPAILLDHEMHLPSISSIRGDSEQNASLAIKRLNELGHRRIACVHSIHSDINPWFTRGYRKGMRDVGLRRRRTWEMFIELSESGAKEAVEHLLAISPRPTAIICFHNTFANQFVAAAVERGLRVPADISVVGCGGEEVVNLSCTQIDWSAMGRKAVEMLLKAVEEGETDEPEHLLVPYRWRGQGTTAAVKHGKASMSSKKGAKNGQKQSASGRK